MGPGCAEPLLRANVLRVPPFHKDAEGRAAAKVNVHIVAQKAQRMCQSKAAPDALTASKVNFLSLLLFTGTFSYNARRQYSGRFAGACRLGIVH
jgi:hypothetical protein